jgi:hypothetical protein
MPANVDFGDQMAVHGWLKTQPDGVAVLFAARAALRVVSALGNAPDRRGDNAVRVDRNNYRQIERLPYGSLGHPRGPYSEKATSGGERKRRDTRNACGTIKWFVDDMNLLETSEGGTIPRTKNS